jgi:hypothetical protein
VRFCANCLGFHLADHGKPAHAGAPTRTRHSEPVERRNRKREKGCSGLWRSLSSFSQAPRLSTTGGEGPEPDSPLLLCVDAGKVLRCKVDVNRHHTPKRIRLRGNQGHLLWKKNISPRRVARSAPGDIAMRVLSTPTTYGTRSRFGRPQPWASLRRFLLLRANFLHLELRVAADNLEH